ncbi:phage tail protein, partial [Escherichia coli]|nr:phage tail protein [Escherichia coli]
FTGADRAALTALTSVGRAILGKTSTQGVLDYLGLGEAAKLPAISGSLSSSGWIKIPVIEGKSFIIQWG